MIDESSWCLNKNNHTLHHGPPNVLANVNCALKNAVCMNIRSHHSMRARLSIFYPCDIHACGVSYYNIII